MSVVSERLQVARETRGLSRYQAAGHLGLQEQRVRQNESGVAPVLLGELTAYGRLYGVSEVWLRGGQSAARPRAGAGC